MGPKPKAATKPYVGPDWLKDASAFDWDKPPPKREAAIKADERIRNPGQPQQPAPALPEAAPGHHPIGLGPWGHEPSINVELPPKPKPHLPHQSMYDYEKDPALVQRRAELVQKVRDELGPDILQAYFSSDACCNVDHVDMVLALPCMCGARVAVNCRPIGTHHSGILEDNGQSIRCDQCVAEVEAKAQRLAACAARSAEEDGGAWNKEEALRRASSSRLQFKKHCCGLSEGKSAHTEFLELVDVRLSLRELCKFVSRDVAASLYYCIYCRSDLHSRTKNRPHTIYTCACCPAAFHRSCYQHQTKERVGQDPGWHCASCAGGLPQGVAAGDGVAEPVGSFILAAPAQRSPVAAHRKARAGPCQQQQQEQQQEEVDEQQQQQQWEEEEDEEKQQQHQEEQEEEQPWAWDDDALDLFLNEPMNSSSSESELSHSSMSRGHQLYAGGEEEVVSPRGPVAPAAHAPAGMPAAAAPFAAPAPAAAGDASPGYPRAVAALKRVQAAFERERMSPGALQPSPHKMSPTTAAPSSPADGAQRRHPPAGLPPAPEPGGPHNAALRQLMMPPPSGGAVSGGSLAGAGTKVAPAPSRMPAGQPGPADQVAEVRQGLGLDSTAVDGRGSKKPAAVLQEGAQAGAMPAGVGSPGPPPQQLVDSILPAPSPLQPQQQDQEHEADSDSSGDEWRQGVKRRKAVPAPPANQPGDDAAAAVSAMENKEPQRRPQPWLKATAIRGRGDLREMLDAAALPLQQLQLPGVGAVGVTPGPAHSPAGKPKLSPANLTSTTPAQQQHRKQRPAGQEARAAAAEAVAAAAAAVAGAAHEPVPAQLQEAGGRAAGGTNQRPVQQGLRRAKLMGGNPAAAKVPLPVPPGAAQAPGNRGRLLQQQLGRERVMVGDVDRVQGGPQQNQALPGLQGLQHEPAGPLLKKQDKHPNPHRKPAAKRRRSATDGGEAAGAAAAVDSGVWQGRDVLPLAPQSNLTNPRAPDALPGASPVNMQGHPQVAAAAAAAAQKPKPAQCPPLPAAAAADMLRPRGNSTASFGQWLPISRGAGAAAADVANPTSVRQGGGGR